MKVTVKENNKKCSIDYKTLTYGEVFRWNNEYWIKVNYRTAVKLDSGGINEGMRDDAQVYKLKSAELVIEEF